MVGEGRTALVPSIPTTVLAGKGAPGGSSVRPSEMYLSSSSVDDEVHELESGAAHQ